MCRTIKHLALVSTVLFVASLVRAEDWPQWRGPRGDGTSLETHIPTTWSATDNIAWKVDLPGIGHSSPIVVGDRIFLTTSIDDTHERVALCFDRKTGNKLWQRTLLTAPLEQKHPLNSYASATPASDGSHVYFAFFEIPKIQLFCLDLDGKTIWQVSPGEFHSIHGFCSSPVLYKDKVILNCDQDAPASIVALDKLTGKEVWRADRPNRTRSYCTPLIRTLAGREQLILSGSKSVASYDANTGETIWTIDGPTEQFVASMVETNGIVFLTAGFPTYHLLAINPDGHGNVTKTKAIWHDHRGAGYVPSPIAAGDDFFVVSDDGIGTCWHADTGKMMWKHRLGPHHSTSAVSAEGNLYFLADDGDMFVFKAGEKWEPIATNSLAEECHASPAIADGQIFIRSIHHLWCIGR